MRWAVEDLPTCGTCGSHVRVTCVAAARPPPPTPGLVDGVSGQVHPKGMHCFRVLAK